MAKIIKNVDKIETTSGTVVDLDNISAGGGLDGVDTTNAVDGDTLVWDATANAWVAQAAWVPAAVPAGEDVFTTPGTYLWTVPTGIRKVCVVCVGGGGGGHRDGHEGEDGGDSWFKQSTLVAGLKGTRGGPLANSGAHLNHPTFGHGGGFVGDGGGNGGFSKNGTSSGSQFYGGGGAGGYTGDGGDGGLSNGSVAYLSPNPTAGQGGGGGGGWWGGGGGVGIYGQGQNGFGMDESGTLNTGGSGGGHGYSYRKPLDPGHQNYPYPGGLYGGGGGGCYGVLGGAGGLGWKNDIAVTPGDQITVVVGVGGYPAVHHHAGNGGHGAVRIIWGDGRSFPTNAA